MHAFADTKFDFKTVTRRRFLFFALNLMLVATGVATLFMLLSMSGWNVWKAMVLALFTVLLVQIVFGFCLAVTGYVLLRRGGDPVRINNSLPPRPEKTESAATAIVMPIYNEDVGRVFQGLRVMYESLQKTGRGKAFDLFILSDSGVINNWIAEELAWLELCKQAGGFGRIFYRKRRVTLHNKSGNIADFCRRWGGSYRYMIVLDADSIMTGATMVRLVDLMEHNSRVGIIQTHPQLVLGKSLFQRVIQFGTRVYGPLFAAGMNFWQFGSGNYWGHNAIIRLRPFVKHCAMPELPKSSPLGRRILSHDTIEAALMRRAGYEVWSAYDLDGSYEEGPPHLVASLQRDQRWCFGNLQHAWLMFKPGIKPASRLHLFNGIMAFVSSPIWFVFLVLNTLLALQQNSASPLPASDQLRGWLLLGGVLGLLFLPKALGTLLVWRSPRVEGFGGRFRLCASVLGEMIFSMTLAPILMLFYTQFVCAAFSGSEVKWNAQNRGGDQLTWGQVVSVHLGQTCLAVAWAGVVAWWASAFLPWMALIFLGLIVALPFSFFTASTAWGQRARSKKWFVIPEEIQTPVELQQVEEPFTTATAPFFQAREYAPDYGLLQAVLDPCVNSLHVSLLRQRVQASLRTREYIRSLGERLLLEGPTMLNPREKKTLLWNAEAMISVHRQLWSSPASHLHDWWQAALRRYNESGVLTSRRMVSRF